ncbi:MAG: helix-turn-helix domain-containing protein, partial [Candidatus Staskawiczbacteria bacterium]|nr:helix-turn-helix domain-containing protein [Candidatus Staskawiczbacteria bacterium]
MSKEKVEEPFVKMYELKGLKANEASFICKVWSFQTNGKRCFLSNPAWAEYLGCSPETVKRIKRRLRNNGYIETDGVFVRLIFD